MAVKKGACRKRKWSKSGRYGHFRTEWTSQKD